MFILILDDVISVFDVVIEVKVWENLNLKIGDKLIIIII